MVQSKSVVFFGLVLVSSWGLISGGVTSSEDMARGFGLECEGSYSLACFKKDIVFYIEKMSHLEEVNILPGMSVVKDANANVTKTSQMVAGEIGGRKKSNSQETNLFISRNRPQFPQRSCAAPRRIPVGQVEQLLAVSHPEAETV